MPEKENKKRKKSSDPSKYLIMPEDFILSNNEKSEKTKSTDERSKDTDKIISGIELDLKNLKASLKGNK